MRPLRLLERGATGLLVGACLAALLASPAAAQLTTPAQPMSTAPPHVTVPSWQPVNYTWKSEHAVTRMASRTRPTATSMPVTSTAAKAAVGRYGRPWPTASELRSSPSERNSPSGGLKFSKVIRQEPTIAIDELPPPPPPEDIQPEIVGKTPIGEYLMGDVVTEGPDAEWSPGEMMGGECCGPQMACPGPLWQYITVFGGAHAFKGPVDQGSNGNFGVHEGFNIGIPLSHVLNMGAQIGLNFVHSDFSGSELEDETRTQTFLTAGLFHRVDCGLQYGAAFDWLHDEYYVEQNMHQVRAEISCANGCGRDIGVMAAFSTADDHAGETTGNGVLMNFWCPVDQFALFCRRRFDCGGEGRIWAGTTGDKDGIIGGEATVPISDRFALNAVVNYILPEESEGDGPDAGHAHEAWGLSINLVWYPGQRARSEWCNPFRPLFGVADNASMIIDRVTE